MTTIDIDNLAHGLAQVRDMAAMLPSELVSIALQRGTFDAMVALLERYAARLAEVEAERDRLAAELAEARMVLRLETP